MAMAVPGENKEFFGIMILYFAGGLHVPPKEVPARERRSLVSLGMVGRLFSFYCIVSPHCYGDIGKSFLLYTRRKRRRN